jgi:hypothetical protein
MTNEQQTITTTTIYAKPNARRYGWTATAQPAKDGFGVELCPGTIDKARCRMTLRQAIRAIEDWSKGLNCFKDYAVYVDGRKILNQPEAEAVAQTLDYFTMKYYEKIYNYETARRIFEGHRAEYPWQVLANDQEVK